MWECINDPSLDTTWSLQNVYKHVSFRNSTILLFPKRIQDPLKHSIISKIKNADIQSIWHILSLNEPPMFDDDQGGQEWNKGRVRSLWPASQGRRWDPDAAGKKTPKINNTPKRKDFKEHFLKPALQVIQFETKLAEITTPASKMRDGENRSDICFVNIKY